MERKINQRKPMMIPTRNNRGDGRSEQPPPNQQQQQQQEWSEFEQEIDRVISPERKAFRNGRGHLSKDTDNVLLDIDQILGGGAAGGTGHQPGLEDRQQQRPPPIPPHGTIRQARGDSRGAPAPGYFVNNRVDGGDPSSNDDIDDIEREDFVLTDQIPLVEEDQDYVQVDNNYEEEAEADHHQQQIPDDVLAEFQQVLVDKQHQQQQQHQESPPKIQTGQVGRRRDSTNNQGSPSESGGYQQQPPEPQTVQNQQMIRDEIEEAVGKFTQDIVQRAIEEYAVIINNPPTLMGGNHHSAAPAADHVAAADYGEKEAQPSPHDEADEISSEEGEPIDIPIRFEDVPEEIIIKRDEYLRQEKEEREAEETIKAGSPLNDEPATNEGQDPEPDIIESEPESEPEPEPEEPEIQPLLSLSSIDPFIIDLIYWKEPTRSGVALVEIIMLLFCLARYSVISVIANSLLITVAMTLSYRIYIETLAAFGLGQPGNPFKKWLDYDIRIPEERVHAQVDVSLPYVQDTVHSLRQTVFVEDSIGTAKLAIGLWCLAYLGSLISGLSLLILCVISLFSVPKAMEYYHQRQKGINRLDSK